jgi:alpha-D-xyloside xylohydrolase
MLQKRQFIVKAIDGNSKTVTYTGKKIRVKL